MKICVAFLISLGLGLGCAPNANAQSPCPPPSTAPSMTIKFFNDEPPGGSYIFPVFTTGGPAFRERLKAWFCVDGPYAATKLSRIYINPSSGIAPGQSVTLQLPLYTINSGTNLPDPYIDWWTGDTIELFYSPSATPPRPLTELLAGMDPNNPNQAPLIPHPAGLPTCTGSNGCVLQFFVDTASIGKSNPSQLIEFNLGATQACSELANPLCKPPRPPGFSALDTRNVDIDVSYVNVAFGPATLAPFENDQTGFVGTPQPAENFSIALSKFLASGLGTGWPQFVHTYADKTKETLFKLASPLEIFARLSPPSTCTAAGTCTWDTPTDLCGFTTTANCNTPTGQLLWPGALWQPMKKLADGWRQHAGTVEAYPKQQPPGTCGTNPPAGTFCAAIMDVKQLLVRNYINYTSLMTNRLQGACVPYILPLNDFILLAHVYPWTPFVEVLGQPLGWKNGDKPNPPNPGCTLGASENLLQNTPIPGGGSYSDNNFALYQQVKLEFDKLNYNKLTDTTLPYIFNPWVGCSQISDPTCNLPDGLIHGSNRVNAPNVYAYSVDDAVGNLQSEGGGFIIDVGSAKNLCTGTTPCPNQNPAGPPINVNLAIDFNQNINFTNYGVCKYDPSDPISYKTINTLNKSFIINPSNPQVCPVFLVDNKSPPQLYTFTVTTPPAQAPQTPPPYILVPPGTPFSSATAAVINCAAMIDCGGNKIIGNKPGDTCKNATFYQSSQVWCCKTRPNNLILGVWASSQQDTTSAHKSFQHFVITNVAQQATTSPLLPGEQICSLGQPVQ